jgi:putative tricarboxylic transport membrane protein
LKNELTVPKKSNPERSSAILCFIFAVVIGIEAYRLNPGRLGSPGPGLTPLLYAFILAGLSAILFFRSSPKGEGPPIVLKWRPVLSILAILLIYGLLIEWLGYLLCTFVVMFLLSRMGKVNWLGSLLLAGMATVFINLLFVRWLAVPLPIGSIFP